jgi:hypothetical protein
MRIRNGVLGSRMTRKRISAVSIRPQNQRAYSFHLSKLQQANAAYFPFPPTFAKLVLRLRAPGKCHATPLQASIQAKIR